MAQTIFGEDCFSEEATNLYNQITSQKKVKQNLGVVESYNFPTSAHNRGVAQLVAEYVTNGIVDYSQEQKEKIVRVAALHDIGKLSIAKSILESADKLAPKDWFEIEKHPSDGFHRYVLSFDEANEALPILLHHTMQKQPYPSDLEQKKAVSIYDLPSNELNNEEVLTNTILIAVADHFEARYPITNIDHPLAGIRLYAHRKYSVDDLPILVRASFIEAGVVQGLSLGSLLDKLLECSKEVIFKNSSKQ